MPQSNLVFAADKLLGIFKATLSPPFGLTEEEFERVKDGLQESLKISQDLALLEGLAPLPGAGRFIDLDPDGKQRTDYYQKMISDLSNSSEFSPVKEFLNIIKFRINATHIRTLIDTLEVGGPGGKATHLLIHPARKEDKSFTLVLAAGNADGNTIDKSPTAKVLDEINPCKTCPKLEQ